MIEFRNVSKRFTRKLDTIEKVAARVGATEVQHLNLRAADVQHALVGDEFGRRRGVLLKSLL